MAKRIAKNPEESEFTVPTFGMAGHYGFKLDRLEQQSVGALYEHVANMNARHAAKLLETQGVLPTHIYKLVGKRSGGSHYLTFSIAPAPPPDAISP